MAGLSEAAMRLAAARGMAVSHISCRAYVVLV